jgi:hypothetical protein
MVPEVPPLASVNEIDFGGQVEKKPADDPDVDNDAVMGVVPGCSAVIVGWFVSVFALIEAIALLFTEKLRIPTAEVQDGTGVSVVATVAVPEQAAVPLESWAVVGGAVAPFPPAVITRGVPGAMVLAPVKTTVAVAPAEPLLKRLRLQDWPAVPAIGPSEEVMVAVPEQLAEPLERVAVVDD